MADKENLILKVQLVDYARSWDSLYIDDIYAVVEDVLKLEPTLHIGVIQKGFGHAPKSYNIGIKNEETWFQYQVSDCLEKKFDLDTGKTVFISMAYEQYKVVTVKNVPPHWEKDYVERVLSFYGVIVNMRQETLRFTEKADSLRYGYLGIWNGNWKVRMKVTRAIPSTIIINDAIIELHYRNQIKTCWRCGMDHKKKDCRTKPDDYINKLNPEQFPELPKRNGRQQDEMSVQSDAEVNNDEENMGEDENDEHTGEKETEEHTEEKDTEKHTEEESIEEDMNAIRPATPKEGQGNKGNKSIINSLEQIDVNDEIINEENLTQDKDGLIKKAVDVEVEHSYASQNVKGALASPLHMDDEADATVTASEDEISGITPGQLGPVGLDSVDTAEILDSQDTEAMENLILLSQLEGTIAQECSQEDGTMESSQENGTQDGCWTIYGKKRNRGTSDEEESEKTVKANFGNFDNSIIGTGSSNRKKLKETEGEKENL